MISHVDVKSFREFFRDNRLHWVLKTTSLVKVKVKIDLYSASSCTHLQGAPLRYGTRSQAISQFYLHTPRSSANGMNLPSFLSSRNWYSFTDTGRIKGWVGLGVWLHTEINVRHRELNPDTVTHPSTNRARRRLTSFIETNALPLHQTTINNRWH